MSIKNRFRSDPFTDLLFNALLGFTFLFLVAIMFMNPEAKSGIIDPKAEYILTITWDDFSPDDIDVWVEDPEVKLSGSERLKQVCYILIEMTVVWSMIRSL